MKTQSLCLALAVVLLCPNASAQWVKTNGPYGGRVQGVYWKDTTALVSIQNGGLYKLRSDGSAWEGSYMTNDDFYMMDAIEGSGSNLYCAGRSIGVFVSTDYGRTWSLSTNGLPSSYWVNCLASNGNEVFAGTWRGLFLSTDSGKNWAPTTSPEDTSFYSLAMSGTTMLIHTLLSGSLYLSTNGGTNWSKVDSGLASVSGRIALAISGPNLYVGSKDGVRKSTDDGKSWFFKNTGLPQPGWSYGVNALSASGSNLFAAVNGSGVYLSTNGGDNWISTNLYDPRLSAVKVNGVNVLAGSSAGIYISNDFGRNWTSLNSGVPKTDVNGLMCTASKAFAGTSAGLFGSMDSGVNWGDADWQLGNTSVSSFATIGTNLVAAGESGIYLSNTSGFFWTNVGDPSNGFTYPSWIKSIASNGSIIYAGNWTGVHSSDNLALSWSHGTTGLTDSNVNVVLGRGTNVFAGTSSGPFLSTDNGSTWSLRSSGLNNQGINSLAAMESYLLAGTPTGVFLSSDDGANWAPTGLMGPSVLCLMVDGSYIFAGTDDGVFFSRDTGTSWIQRNDGLHANVYVRALATDGTSLFAGLYNDGVWKRPLSEITAVSTYPQNMLPLSVELYQNYPNPFNPSTTIKFELPKASQVLLTVYNTLGQQVATLVHGQQEAGSYEVKFDGSGLASGVYFYRLQAGTYVETRKVLLLK